MKLWLQISEKFEYFYYKCWACQLAANTILKYTLHPWLISQKKHEKGSEENYLLKVNLYSRIVQSESIKYSGPHKYAIWEISHINGQSFNRKVVDSQYKSMYFWSSHGNMELIFVWITAILFMKGSCFDNRYF